MMRDHPIKVKFDNKSNPKSSFDLVKLEELFSRKGLDHDIEIVHNVEFFIIYFVTDGQGYHTVDFKDYKVEKGSLLTIRKGQIHQFSRSSNLKGIFI